ncbi:MAG: hypothetical protein Q9211_002590 [Gyalolechia sp. 1 TL-2023]
MIGGPVYPNWGAVFGSLLFALATLLCYHLLFGRPPKKTKASIHKRPFTLRIEVQLGTSSNDLRRDLLSLIESDSILKQDAITVEIHSIVPMDKRIAYATATFHTSIPKSEMMGRLSKARTSLPYLFDDDFQGITPLYEASGGADVDVIAVPGLGSHAIGSWKSPSNNDLWLRDYLPDDVPNIRVLLYGYNTPLLDNDSKDSIENLGGRFLEALEAFRAENALIHAHKRSANPQHLDICKACHGLLFFGVPNLGLRNEQLKSIVQGQPNEALIRELIVDNDSEPSTFLKRISDQFSECCRGQYQVIAFFERKLSPTVQLQRDGTLTKTGPKMYMVTEKSATSTGLTATAEEHNIALNTDHSGLVKYKSRNQEEYIIVKANLKTLVTDAKREVGKRFAEKDLTPEQERIWGNLNQPPYTSFRNSSKIAKPEKGTLKWLVREECTPDPEIGNQSIDEKTLRMEDFISWRDSDKSELLLISAPPGRGKSVLSNFIVGHLESRISPNPSLSTKIIYYFCNIKNDEASRNANSVLRALIVQLCMHLQRLFQILPSEYERNSRQFFSASFDTLIHIFEKMLQGGMYTRVYCVIDGLDVYEEGMSELITKTAEIFNVGTEAKSSVLKLLYTTRPKSDILDSLTTSKHRILRCSPDDLETFIDSRVSGLGEKFTPGMKRMINRQLREKTDNTFLWLDVVIRRIKSIGLPTERRIEETVKDSPQDLDDLYHVLVQGFVQRDKDSARLLACVVYARCPLDLRALQDAVAIDPKEKYTAYEQCEPYKPSFTPGEFYNTFGTLLDVAEDKVYCIHQSVKDYFERRNPLKDAMELKPRLILAHVSMAYLSLEDFGNPWQDRGMLKRNFPFFDYAATYWYSHIETTADFRGHLHFQDFLKEIVPPSTHKAQVWMNEHHHVSTYSMPSCVSEVAIQFDIGWLAELILNEEPCGIVENFGTDCLSRAAKREGVVLEVLLKHERCMEFTITDDIVRAIANYQRCTTMTLLLDRRGTDVQITEEVLRAAAWNRNGKEIITLLLDRQPDIQITEEVVLAAAGNWRRGEEIITLLLDRRGADIQITEKVVLAAAGNWHGEEIITLLLNRRADIQITEEVIRAAAGNSNKEIITLLLDRRADIQITEEVVRAAAGNWNGEIMTILLNRRGADIRITEEVVRAAAENSSKEIMTVLLDRRGADIQITEEVVRAAAGNWNGKEIIPLLLERRADIQITEEVVRAAAGNWNGKEIIPLLLNRRGADIQITEEVLLAAAGNWNGKKIITLLLDRRPDIQITEKVVRAAAENEESGTEIITLLLNQKVVSITEEVAERVAECFDHDQEVMTLLHNRRAANASAAHVQITEENGTSSCSEPKERVTMLEEMS